MKKETIERIIRFSEDRDWDQFHSPANLAKSISIEANELLECFQWSDENYDLEAVKEELAAKEPSVIISRRPCALLKYVKPKAPLQVNDAKCVGCKACMKIGCPAISFKGGKAFVDQTQCVGCGVCKQLCAKNAFEAAQ